MATKPTARTARPRRSPPASQGPSPVYVYGLVQSAAPPRLGRVAGLPDAGPPRLVPLGRSRWLIVADVPPARFNEGALTAGLQDLDWVGACAMAHDALVMHAMKSGTVVPMRLFTIFEDEARARDQALRASRQIGRTLRRIAGRAEYGVRIGVSPSSRRRPAPAPRPLTGRSFLERKREQLAARRAPGGVPLAERTRVFERLAELADDARDRPLPAEGSAVWLDGAFLVRLDRAAAFRREVGRLSGELSKEGHDVVLTGPWPPYSFLDEHAAES